MLFAQNRLEEKAVLDFSNCGRHRLTCRGKSLRLDCAAQIWPHTRLCDPTQDTPSKFPSEKWGHKQQWLLRVAVRDKGAHICERLRGWEQINLESLLPFPARKCVSLFPISPHFYPVVLNSFPKKLHYYVYYIFLSCLNSSLTRCRN
jgi:hypothetical protein